MIYLALWFLLEELQMQGKVFGEVVFCPLFIKGVQCRSKGDPVLYLKDPKGVSRNLKKKVLASINEINLKEYKKFGDPEVLTRINQYEMAFRMQISVPEVMDIDKESDTIKDMYGVQPGKESFANNCLFTVKWLKKG